MSSALSSNLMSMLGGVVASTTADIEIAGQNISGALQDCTLSLCYKESVSDKSKSDTLEIRIADPEGLFRQSFTLDAYATVTCTLTTVGGPNPGEKVLSTMYIKTVHMGGDKGGGTDIEISCVSIPPQTNFRMTKGSKGWDSQTLKQICQDVASQNGWSLQYLATVNPVIQRVDQHDHSHANVLQRICSEQDCVMKVVNNTLYIRSKTDIEQLSPTDTIYLPGGLQSAGLEHWNFEETTEDIYSSAVVNYLDPLTGRTTIATVTDPNQPANGPVLYVHSYLHCDNSTTQPIQPTNIAAGSGTTTVPSTHTVLPTQPSSNNNAVINEPSSSAQQQAIAVGTNKLKQKNRKQNKLAIRIPLNLSLDAGTTYNVSGFTPDADAQVWVLDTLEHRLSGKSGSTTHLSFEKSLNPSGGSSSNVIGVHQASSAQIAAATANAHAAGF